MFYIILITLIGVNIAPLLMPGIDMWHSQGIFVQSGILLIFCWTFFEKPKYQEPKNIPLGLLLLWIGILISYICFKAQFQGKYDIQHFFPFFNFICLIIYYKAIVRYLSIDNIRTIYLFIKYSIIVTLFLCTLQAFGLSQCFELINPNYNEGNYLNNLVSGFIGNGTHLSGFLAMCIPFFLYKINRENILSLILLFVILFFYSGQTKGDIPISGIIVAISVISFYLFYTKKQLLIFWILILCICSITIYNLLPRDFWQQFFEFNGRIYWWLDYLSASRKYFITGMGLGTINIVSLKLNYPRHLHFEYLHFMVEIGFIGLILILNLIKSVLAKKHSNLGLIYKTAFLGFCISAVFNYPAHLWLPSIYACFCYSSIIALKEREQCFLQEKI